MNTYLDKGFDQQPHSTAALLLGPLEVDPDVALPRRVHPRIEFDRATTAERDALRTAFQKFGHQLGLNNVSAEYYYESKWTTAVEDLSREWGRSVYSEPDPADGFPYYVFRSGGETRQPQQEIHSLYHHALHLVYPPMGTTMTVSFSPDGQSIGVNSGTRAVDPTFQPEYPVQVDERLLEDLTELTGCFADLKDGRDDQLTNALSIFSDSFYISRFHRLHMLGLFISVESLLVHKPANHDPSDSIGRQLRRSIPLLLRRVDQLSEFDCDEYPIVRLISDLYEFRSAVAHGHPISMAVPPRLSASLGSSDQIYRTLLRLVQGVFRAALREPELARDLKG